MPPPGDAVDAHVAAAGSSRRRMQHVHDPASLVNKGLRTQPRGSGPIRWWIGLQRHLER